jgi:hypothetical protein
MNNVVDKATEKFGPKPTPQQVAEMAKYRGITYQRNGNKDKGQSSVPKVSPPVILQNWDRGNEKNLPFYLSLLVNDKVLHNCMLDSGASSNVMTKKVMETIKSYNI